MTRHRLRREPLVRPGRTMTVAAIVIVAVGVVLARPADAPDPTVGEAYEVPSASTAPTVPAVTHTPTPSATATPAPTPSPTPASSPAPRPAPDPSAEMEDEVTRLTNAERAAAGCGPLRTDERLRKAARGHSEDMAARQYFAHESPEGETPWDRAAAEGYDSPSGENIARGFPDPASAVAAWMDSPGHRANILNCESRATGVGVELDGTGSPYWTQMFGYE